MTSEYAVEPGNEEFNLRSNLWHLGQRAALGFSIHA
jgi:hypothetical protein